MRWLTPKELAKVSGKSERTLRHYASKGKLKVKKDGSIWLIEPMSAIAAGIKIPPDFLESLKNPEEKPLPSSHGNSATSAASAAKKSLKSEEQTSKESERKYKSLGELGVYKDLLEVFRQEHEKVSKQINDYMKRCLQCIALGFYEYSRDKKVEHYKQARVFLVSCLVEDDVTAPEKSTWREAVETALIPGVIGLIRQNERRSHNAKASRNSEASGKNR